MAKQKEQTGREVIIPPVNKQMMELPLVGDTSLIPHAWSEKAKKQMLDKQMKKAKQGREAKDPERDYRESLYWLDKKGIRIPVKKMDPAKHGMFGFPSIAFKAAAVRAATDVGLKMTDTRRAFHIQGEFVPIRYGKIKMREDMVRIGNGVADIRYRGEFVDWACTLLIRYNANLFSPEQIVNLFNTAGFGVGVGEWRAERTGAFGLFHVA